MSAAGGEKKMACVTGGNGYIASTLIKMILEKGYAVKSQDHGQEPRDLQALEEGSFDDAVGGCDYVFLVAAPVNLASEDPEVRSQVGRHHCLTLTVLTAPLQVDSLKPTRCMHEYMAQRGDEAGLATLKGIEKTSGAVQLVHVDDLCRAEMFVAEEAAAGRYICCILNTTVVELAHFLAHNTDDQLLDKPRVSLSSAKLVREGFDFKYKTLDGIYHDVVEYGKALGILHS
ncbi:unnamed protein product [Urochloa decumbens]|uniref:Uncharacterized protein n=1 Tax=Urochloa decumbens TaxID=240449 RepID=A0ABC9D1D6_9POAL